MIANPQALTGQGVVITRPAEQAQGLAERVREAGGRPFVFPAIEIAPVADPSLLNAIIDRLDSFDIAIFVSPSAAQRGMRAVHARRTLPATLKVAAIGSGSASALRAEGIAAVSVPAEGADSESLLKLPDLQAVSGKRVVIFRGEGGREVLAHALSASGAHVEYAECYRRVRPRAAIRPLEAAWGRGDIHAVTATSSEGLRNFHGMLGEETRARFTSTPVFVPHHRIADAASALGLRHVVATPPGDAAIVAAITAHFLPAR